MSPQSRSPGDRCSGSPYYLALFRSFCCVSVVFSAFYSVDVSTTSYRGNGVRGSPADRCSGSWCLTNREPISWFQRRLIHEQKGVQSFAFRTNKCTPPGSCYWKCVKHRTTKCFTDTASRAFSGVNSNTCRRVAGARGAGPVSHRIRHLRALALALVLVP